MLGAVGSNLEMVRIDPTTPNMSQHIATGWPNARNMLGPTMLRYVALACCDRLAGAFGQAGALDSKYIKGEKQLVLQGGKQNNKSPNLFTKSNLSASFHL